MGSWSIPFPLLPKSVRWALVVAVGALICYASLVTVPETVVDDAHPEFIPLNYWRHIVAYFVFAGSLAYATDEWDLTRWRHAAVVIAVAAGYGVTMEVGQHFLPHRTPFLYQDAIVNTLGASGIVGWFLARPYLDLKPVGEMIVQLQTRVQ